VLAAALILGALLKKLCLEIPQTVQDQTACMGMDVASVLPQSLTRLETAGIATRTKEHCKPY
jgi:hypothetical protein